MVDLQSALNSLFFDVDQYCLDIDDSESNEYLYGKGKLRSIVKEKTFPILQKYCDTENQLLWRESNTDLNSIVRRSYTILLLTGGILLMNLISFIRG